MPNLRVAEQKAVVDWAQRAMRLMLAQEAFMPDGMHRAKLREFINEAPLPVREAALAHIGEAVW